MGERLDGIESELARRLVHVSGSLLPIAYVVDILTWRQLRAIVVAGCVLAIALEVLRLFVGFEWVVYDYLAREYEQDNVAGYALAVISATGVILLASPKIAVPAILMLTLGDPISGLLGSGETRAFGDAEQIELLVKRPRVLAVMFVVCTAIGIGFVTPVAAVLGGLAAMVADGVKPIVATYVVDDNLTIPPAAAVAIAVGLVLS